MQYRRSYPGASRRPPLTVAAAALLCWGGIAAGPARAVADGIGDTFGFGPVQIDIATVDAFYGGGSLQFLLTFANPIAAPSTLQANSVGGYIDLDTDQNGATGGTPFQVILGQTPVRPLGIEFWVDLTTEAAHPGLVDVRRFEFINPVGTGPVVYGTNDLTVTIPLSLLNNDEGLVHYGVVIGTLGALAEITDEVPDGPAPLTSTARPQQAPEIPEPATLSLLGAGLLGFAVTRRRRFLPNPRPRSADTRPSL